MDSGEEMSKFPETYNVPRLNQEETENMNRLITSNQTEWVIKNTPSKQNSRTWWLHRQILHTIRKKKKR